MDNVWARCFPHVFRERSFKSRQNPRADFFYGKKRLGRIQYGVFQFTVAGFVLDGLLILQLPCIRVEEAVSWTQRFLTRKFGLKNRSLFMTNKFKRKFYVSSKQEKEWYGKTTSYLEQPSSHFCQHFMRGTTQQTLLAINLASQQKTTKLYFPSQVRKQFKLLAVPFKPLRCCLRNDKLVNCHVRKFCKDLFLNLRVIWSVNQIVLLNGFLSDFVFFIGQLYKQD